MTDIPPPAQDLAVIDRAGDLALAFDLVTEEFAEILDRLRGYIARDAQDAEVRARDLAVGDAFARRRWAASDVHSDEAKTEVGADIRAAVAAVGAEIVWPSPEVGEDGSGPAAGGTAPGAVPPPTDTASALHRQCEKNPACAAPAGHKTPCWVLTNIAVTEAGEGESPAGDGTAPAGYPPAPPQRFTRLHRTDADEKYGFPEFPVRGEIHTDRDGGRWEYEYRLHVDHMMRNHWGRTSSGEPSVREKILAEAAEVSYNTAGKDAEGLVALAVSVLSPGSRGPVTRYAVVNAIALLADAVERMRGAR